MSGKTFEELRDDFPGTGIRLDLSLDKIQFLIAQSTTLRLHSRALMRAGLTRCASQMLSPYAVLTLAALFRHLQEFYFCIPFWELFPFNKNVTEIFILLLFLVFPLCAI